MKQSKVEYQINSKRSKVMTHMDHIIWSISYGPYGLIFVIVSYYRNGTFLTVAEFNILTIGHGGRYRAIFTYK